MVSILNIVDLPVPIDARPDVLGTRSRVSLGIYSGELCAPTLGDKSYREAFAELHPPRVRGIEALVRVFEHTYQASPSVMEWGMPTIVDKQGSDIRLVSIKKLVLRVFAEDLLNRETVSRVGGAIMDSFSAWFVQFLTWLEVLTGQDLDVVNPYEGWGMTGLGLTHPWVIPEGEDLVYDYVNRPIVGVLPDEESGVSKRQWKRAVAAANAALHVPGPHLLIRDARAALIRSDYRRALIDTGTAVELTLSKVLEAKLLQTLSKAAVGELLSRVRGFDNRQRVARKLGMRLPDDLYQAVASPRNDVLHRNMPAMKEAAKRSLGVGKAVVQAHVPLPRC